MIGSNLLKTNGARLLAAVFAGSVAFSASIRAAEAAPDVVVSIKPVHSLVAAIMEGVSTPQLIVEGAASPHTYNLKPSDARKLQKADVVFWIGSGFEAFLEKPLDAIVGKATVVELEDAPGLVKLPFREGGAFEKHVHEGEDGDHDHDHGDEKHEHGEHEGHDHDHGMFDTHLWLDPKNAKAIAAEIGKTLAAADPANAAIYEKNGKELASKLDALDSEIATEVAPVRGKPFIVFHDAYQYFENRYGLSVAGSITVSPETAPGAARIREIHEKVAALQATCVFAEPQFEPKLVRAVTEGTKAKSGVLDPEAATLEPGPGLYFTLIRSLASSLRDCLS